eukprot:scaffold104775_cov17-Tisochrysis_lutea.AAC.3
MISQLDCPQPALELKLTYSIVPLPVDPLICQQQQEQQQQQQYSAPLPTQSLHPAAPLPLQQPQAGPSFRHLPVDDAVFSGIGGNGGHGGGSDDGDGEMATLE